MLPGLSFVLLLSTIPTSAKLVREVQPGAPAPAPSATPAREVTALAADPVMKIDGVLDEPCWQTGLWVNDFTLNDGTGRRPEATTQFRVRFNAASLYVAVRATEPNMARLKTTDGASHDQKAFNDDCFELWVDPDNARRQAYHVIYSVAGGTYDALQREEPRDDPQAATPGGKRNVFTEDLGWDAHGEVAFAKRADGWTCELRLPVADLGLKTILPGSVWGFNLARERYAFPEAGRAEYSAFTGVFCEPMTAFANLRLGLSPVEVTALDLGTLGVGDNSLRLECRSPREELAAVEARLTVHAAGEQVVRWPLVLKGRDPATETIPYTLPADREFTVTLELLRSGTEEVLFRRSASGRTGEPVRLRPEGPIASRGREPWWVDVELLLGNVSQGTAQVQVTLLNASGHSVARAKVKKIYPSFRLQLNLGGAKEGDYRVVVAVLDGAKPLGEAAVPVRVQREE